MGRTTPASSTPIAGLASVLIPAGKVDHWLVGAIESALANDYPHLELVIVINGAGSEAVDLPEDERIVVERHQHRLGVAGANRRCIELAHGEFLVHLDADDVIAPDRIRKQVDYLKLHPTCVVVGSRVEYIDSAGAAHGESPTVIGDDVRSALTRFNVLAHSSATIRASAVRAGGSYDDLDAMEDYGLWLKLARLGPIAVLDEVLASYRLHEGQMSRDFRPTAPYVRAVMARRRELARQLGIPTMTRLRNDAWYLAVQWGMLAKAKIRGLRPAG